MGGRGEWRTLRDWRFVPVVSARGGGAQPSSHVFFLSYLSRIKLHRGGTRARTPSTSRPRSSSNPVGRARLRLRVAPLNLASSHAPPPNAPTPSSPPSRRSVRHLGVLDDHVLNLHLRVFSWERGVCGVSKTSARHHHRRCSPCIHPEQKTKKKQAPRVRPRRPWPPLPRTRTLIAVLFGFLKSSFRTGLASVRLALGIMGWTFSYSFSFFSLVRLTAFTLSAIFSMISAFMDTVSLASSTSSLVLFSLDLI